MKTLRILAAACALLAVPTLTQAQTIARWDFKIFNVGAPAPISTTQMVVGTNTTCNLTTVPSGAPNPANPTAATWNDPVNAGKFCQYSAAPTDPLIAMPITGNPLEGAAAAVSTTGLSSADSPRVPFTKPGTAPAVPTGFTLR